MGIDYSKRPGDPAAAGQPVGGAAGSGQGAGISLSKVTLTKASPTVSLTKSGGGSGVLRVNLNWTARPEGAAPAAPAKGGFLKRLAGAASGANSAIDLDLGCLYEFTDGAKGVVQALGNAFDATTSDGAKVIWLDGDDRSGAAQGGENLQVDLRHSDKIKRVLVFAFIYQGVPNWAGADAVVTLFPASGPQVEVRLDDQGTNSPMCAIAVLENTGGELSVRREIRYIEGGQDKLDKEFGWGMNWKAGRK